MRASDAERSAVEERLRRAQEVGQLDLTEFDERVKAVWAARTRAELARTTADLPEPAPAPGPRRVFSDDGGGVTMRVLSTIWASAAVVNIVVWGILIVTLGHGLYPWWVWVVFPPGAALGVLYGIGIGRPPRAS
jgi:hypothetical protein